eukprot:CAMPEP_0185022354 /NCGR_PEP_ID=MMETSP1103-20130426/5068_1 /TAXON_ID=36769 /ORGANISM="Paraphysomonas bandaiensis, Strain Caron Lab Isolate" /LENGTH=493 /DNA_ID=CAMNT_0027554387 /DNA_START=10 /DNA_END=1491 /DNA_ORIENTATION=+
MATDYAVVVDAGSTGSRGFIFMFYEEDGRDKIHVTSGLKIKPGLSRFANSTDQVGAYMSPVLADAAKHIPEEFHSKAHVFVLGTAGMRLLSEDEQSSIYDALASDEAIKALPLSVPRKNMWTISGKHEAYYAVVAANFVAGKIDIDLIANGEDMVGALDMGGSSTQLIFHTGTKEGEPLHPDHFWSHSWLSYGADKVQERVWDHFAQKHVTRMQEAGLQIDSEPIVNDCVFKGHVGEYNLSTSPDTSMTLKMTGSGDAMACRENIREVLWPNGCSPDGPCSLDNIEHPPVDGLFFGMSLYYFALDCVRHLGLAELPNWPNSSVDELEEAALSFCGTDWDRVVKLHAETQHPQTSNRKLPYRCVEALYITTLLEDGFGFRGSHRGITMALEVEGTEVEWTLGFALTEECALTRKKSVEDLGSNNIASGFVGGMRGKTIAAAMNRMQLASRKISGAVDRAIVTPIRNVLKRFALFLCTMKERIIGVLQKLKRKQS